MSGFAMENWHDFLVAEAGAGAALAGLVFVAISINLTKVLENRAVSGRAFEALCELLSLLFAALLALIPGQGRVALGIELLILGGVIWAAIIRVALGARNAGGATPAQHRFREVLGQFATLPLVLAGASLLGAFGGGLYWLAASAVFALIAGMIGAWVLLIEILR
jgi:hypothetical protein